MCDRFNGGKYFERMLDDDDESVVIAEIEVNGPAPKYKSDGKKFPNNARSQTVVYRDKWDRVIAIVHQYGTPNGLPCKDTLADPKFIFEDGVRYKYDATLDLQDLIDPTTAEGG